MTQQQQDHKAITWFKTSSHGMNAMLIACAMLGSSTAWAIDPSVKELRIGYQKSSINFAVAKEQKLYEKEFPNAKITWNEFPAGPQILEALAVGSVDIGVTGDTPPVYAQAANKPLYYIAYEAAKPLASAILVPKNSSLKKLSDLKGKRIALQKGSSAHYLLVQAVRKAGLKWTDIQPIWLSPADARAAFQKGAVDAWAIWDPYYASTQLEDQAKVLAAGKGLSPNYTFYLAAPEFVKQHPQAIKGVIQQINLADAWVQKNQQATANLIAKNTGLKPNVSLTFVQRRPRPSIAAPLTKKVILEQQQLANRFSELKIIPNQINIQQAVWAGK
ncbi:sulfonate ABC transporter substrate-binding protein [Acinetobacter sp. SFB]|nr:sulfonate ABC transporter substrate-binding protein [Acinetobacter sp. SFB]